MSETGWLLRVRNDSPPGYWLYQASPGSRWNWVYADEPSQMIVFPTRRDARQREEQFHRLFGAGFIIEILSVEDYNMDFIAGAHEHP